VVIVAKCSVITDPVNAYRKSLLTADVEKKRSTQFAAEKPYASTFVRRPWHVDTSAVCNATEELARRHIKLTPVEKLVTKKERTAGTFVLSFAMISNVKISHVRPRYW